TVRLDTAYDLLLMETEHVAPILNNPWLKATTIVLRVQNDETDYLRQMKQSTPSLFKKHYYETEARRFSSLSRFLFNKADALWFISEILCKEQPANLGYKSFVLPPPLDIDQFCSPPLRSRQALFIGTLAV